MVRETRPMICSAREEIPHGSDMSSPNRVQVGAIVLSQQSSYL